MTKKDFKINDSLIEENKKLQMETSILRNGYFQLERTLIKLKKSEEMSKRIHSIVNLVGIIDRLILSESDEMKLLSKVCKILTKIQDYKFVWIGQINSNSYDVIPVIHAGVGSNYFKKVKIRWDNSKYGCGPTGESIKTKKIQINRSTLDNSKYRPWRKEAHKRGFLSSVSVPLFIYGQVWGVIGIYSSSLGSFGEDEVNILKRLSDDVSLALTKIKSEFVKNETDLKLKQLAYIIENTLEGHAIFSLCKKSKLLYVNKAWENITGYKKNTIVNRKEPLMITALRKNPDQYKRFKRAVKLKQTFQEEMEWTTKSGENIFVDVLSMPLSEKGKSCQWFNTIRDITEKKNREKLVNDIKNRDEAILHSIGDAVVACDIKGKIILFNKKAEEITGIKEIKAIGRNNNEILTFKDISNGKSVNKFLHEAIKTDKILSIPNSSVLVRSDGKIIPVADSVSPIKNINGVTIGCVVVFRDVTKERELEQAKNDFLSITSHQLRTPLSATKWVLETLFDDVEPTIKQNEKYGYLTISNERLIHLVNRMLNITRIESGKLIINKKLVNFSKLINEVNESLKVLSKKKNKRIIYILPEHINKIYCDPILIHEVLDNLLNNALYYSDENSSEIQFRMKELKTEYLLSVHNDGCVDESDLKKINNFDKFARGRASTSIEPAGSGLGLYITKKLIEAHGGALWVESSPQKGTTFYITLIKQ